MLKAFRPPIIFLLLLFSFHSIAVELKIIAQGADISTAPLYGKVSPLAKESEISYDGYIRVFNSSGGFIYKCGAAPKVQLKILPHLLYESNKSDSYLLCGVRHLDDERSQLKAPSFDPKRNFFWFSINRSLTDDLIQSVRDIKALGVELEYPSNADIQSVAKLDNIELLMLDDCQNTTDLSPIKALGRLSVLEVREYRNAIGFVAKMPCLKYLDLVGCYIDEEMP